MTSSVAGQNRAAWLVEAKGAIEVGPAEIVKPEKGEVLIRARLQSSFSSITQAVPITPAEVLIKETAILKLQYPTVLGSSVAGFVEAIGEDVTRVQLGDRVVGGTSIYPSGGVAKYGGQQRYTIAPEMEVVNIGETDFAVAVASATNTGAYALFAHSTLKMERPVDPLHPRAKAKKILIWGGSSSTGLVAIGYAKQAGYTVISTCSPHNFPLLQEKGTDHIFDYHEATTVNKIRDLFPIDYWFDTISVPASLEAIIKILSPLGRDVVKADILTLRPPSMPGMPALPEGVTAKMNLFRNKAEENKDLVDWLLAPGGYLEKGLQGGWIRGVPPTKIGGLEAYESGLEKLAKGVSGTRLVVEPWKN